MKGKMASKYFHQLITGISFGLTSGTITALGMLVGLDSATSSKFVIVAGLIVMAVADGLADACGMHLAEEAECDGEGEAAHTSMEIWLSTAFTFLSVCGFILTFTIPIFLFPLTTAIPIAIAYGMILLIIFNFQIAKIRKESKIKIIGEHVLIAIVVIIVSYMIGSLISALYV
jgi:VIT1/CCC1 family predicted Fe2+/Mn2+ transporter